LEDHVFREGISLVGTWLWSCWCLCHVAGNVKWFWKGRHVDIPTVAWL